MSVKYQTGPYQIIIFLLQGACFHFKALKTKCTKKCKNLFSTLKTVEINY